MLTYILIFILAICGFLVAKHIRNHKTKHTPLICPGRFDCHTVVHSDYSKFLGVPVESFGMAYYALVGAIFLLLIFFSSVAFPLLLPALVLLSLGAFLFSLYLISVQVFVLKKGCSWCLISALISALIFVLLVL